MDVLMVVPVQKGLSFELTLGLQNGDEINIGFARFWSYFFPFQSAALEIPKVLDDIITGQTRLTICRQFNRDIVRQLEILEGKNWTRVYRDICGLKIPFVTTQTQHLYNTEAPLFRESTARIDIA